VERKTDRWALVGWWWYAATESLAGLEEDASSSATPGSVGREMDGLWLGSGRPGGCQSLSMAMRACDGEGASEGDMRQTWEREKAVAQSRVSRADEGRGKG